MDRDRWERGWRYCRKRKEAGEGRGGMGWDGKVDIEGLVKGTGEGVERTSYTFLLREVDRDGSGIGDREIWWRKVRQSKWRGSPE